MKSPIVDFTFYKNDLLTSASIEEIISPKNGVLKNIVLILLPCKGISLEQIEEIEPLITRYRETTNCSFVLVLDQFSYEELPENLSVVPTIQEAYDFIEMEEMERELLSDE